MPADTDPGLFEIIHTTRSMRRLKSDPVPEELIRKILEAGVCAPSGGNMQRWRFLVVTDVKVKETVASYYKRAWDELWGRPIARARRHRAPIRNALPACSRIGVIGIAPCRRDATPRLTLSSQSAFGSPACCRIPFAVVVFLIFARDAEGALRQRAEPDFVTALAVADEIASSLAQQSAQAAIHALPCRSAMILMWTTCPAGSAPLARNRSGARSRMMSTS